MICIGGEWKDHVKDEAAKKYNTTMHLSAKVFALAHKDGVVTVDTEYPDLPKATTAAFENTRKEVAEHTMSETMTEAEVTERHGPFWNVTRCFGTEQGVDADGNPKFRAIHEHSENGNSSAASRTQ